MSDQSEQLNPEEIEALLAQSQEAGEAKAEAGSSSAPDDAQQDAAPTETSKAPDESTVTPGDMEVLLDQAEQALASIEQPAGESLPEGVESFKFEDFSGTPASTSEATLDLVRDVEMDLTIELGRTHMYLEDLLKLRKGAVVPLDKLAGDPVDVYVNGRLIARGEVLVLNDNFCVRVAELVAGDGPNAERESA
ncbi:MAG: flagellar motor switch protein FliN [Pirellulales bacterium]|nr:flagellar motor switch protein FliN [Pirellulales bacterium]